MSHVLPSEGCAKKWHHFDYATFCLKEEIMKKINFALSLVTGALLVFTVCCSPVVSAPLSFLLLFLLLLQAGLIWMVITVLKNGKPPGETFDQRFYEDSDIRPGK